MKQFVLGLVQMAMDENPETNRRRALEFCVQAARQGAQIICLPELFASRYFCQREEAGRFDLAEPLDGPSAHIFGEFAAQRHVAVVVPVFERRAAGVYHNSVLVIDADGKSLGCYRKMHIPDDPAYYEKFYFTPGDLGFKAFATRHGVVAPLICWDQWYPEAARLATMRGPSALLYPTAIGWHPHEKAPYGQAQYEAWLTVQRGHAIANGVYVAAANRVGYETETDQPGIEFWGASFIADPQGVLLAQASHDAEEVLLANIDLEHIENIRRNWPFLRDRRIDAYDGICRRFIDDV
jgi:N-carbamoylputrescine amidase